MEAIDRVSGLARHDFVAKYLRANRPVIITGALDDWKLHERWTPEALVARFGGELVQLYNSYFDFQRFMTLRQYFADRFGREPSDSTQHRPYVRWYTKLRGVPFRWADAAFEKMHGDWQRPSFLPASDYALPFRPEPAEADPVREPFPAKGLFISERGARTGLHVDPWGSDAVLCQLYGEKRWVMYSPDQAPLLTTGSATVDIDAPDLAKFPDYPRARPTYEFTIAPGDTVYVPFGWHHQATTLTDSISMTWNFVHGANVTALREWIARPTSEIDRDVLAFFYAPHLEGRAADLAAIDELLRTRFGSPRER